MAKVVGITGTGAGVGRATVEEFARQGYDLTLLARDDAPANFFEPVSGHYSAHGRFDARAKSGSWEMFTDRHRAVFWAIAAVAAAVGAAGAHQLAKRLDI